MKKETLSETLTRFCAKLIVLGSGCWEWTASKTPDGYGKFWFANRLCVAHRVSFELAGLQVPEGTELDHLCRNRACVNPAHLEAVTHSVNTKRGEAGKWERERPLACQHGHAFTPENTYVWKPGGFWSCRTCRRDYQREWQRKRRAVA